MVRSWCLVARANLAKLLVVAPVLSCLAAAPDDALQVTATATVADAKTAKPEQKFPEWHKVIEGAKTIEGLFPLYYNEKDQKLFMSIRQNQYEEEFVLPISIADSRKCGADVPRRGHVEFRESMDHQFSPIRRPHPGGPAQREGQSGQWFAASRCGAAFVHRQHHRFPADQKRRARPGPDRFGRPVHDRPGGDRRESGSQPQHLGQGEGVSGESGN